MKRFEGADIGSAVALLRMLGDAFGEINHPHAMQAQTECRTAQRYLAQLGVHLLAGHDLHSALASTLDEGGSADKL